MFTLSDSVVVPLLCQHNIGVHLTFFGASTWNPCRRLMLNRFIGVYNGSACSNELDSGCCACVDWLSNVLCTLVWRLQLFVQLSDARMQRDQLLLLSDHYSKSSPSRATSGRHLSPTAALCRRVSGCKWGLHVSYVSGGVWHSVPWRYNEPAVPCENDAGRWHWWSRWRRTTVDNRCHWAAGSPATLGHDHLTTTVAYWNGSAVLMIEHCCSRQTDRNDRPPFSL